MKMPISNKKLKRKFSAAQTPSSTVSTANTTLGTFPTTCKKSKNCKIQSQRLQIIVLHPPGPQVRAGRGTVQTSPCHLQPPRRPMIPTNNSNSEEDKYHSATTFNHPLCSISCNSDGEGIVKLPRRSKMNVRDSQYFSRPEGSAKTLIGSCSRSFTSSYMACMFADSGSEGGWKK
jgi:hypothetical protein